MPTLTDDLVLDRIRRDLTDLAEARTDAVLRGDVVAVAELDEWIDRELDNLLALTGPG